jgi:DNA-binding transcriptional ArsR family regulator
MYLITWLINCLVWFGGPMATDQLSATFSALADPTRRAILARLVTGEASVTELAEPFEMSMPAISKHLKVLERAGLVARGREAQYRPCRLEVGPLRDVADWVEHYREFWEQSFQRLDAYLRELNTKDKRAPASTNGAKSKKRPRKSSNE